MRDELLKLGHRELATALRTLGNGSIGVDAARKTKDELVDYMLGRYMPDMIAAHFGFGKDMATALREAASAHTQPLPPVTFGCLGAECPGCATCDPLRPVPAKTVAASTNGKAMLPTDKTAKALALSALLSDMLDAPAAQLDETRVRAIADEQATRHGQALALALHQELEAKEGALLRAVAEASAAAAGSPRVLDVRTIAAPSGIVVDGAHPLFEKVLRLVAAGVNVLLVGPAGCGKSHLAEAVAKALASDFASLSLTAGTNESALVGRLLPIGENGRFGYVESPFVRIYGQGGVFLFDELDAADPNMLLVVNSALANGHIEVEQRAASGLPTRVDRAKGTCLLGAANTFGTGASAQYVGRGALDAATLDRWYVISMDYDPRFEASLYGGKVRGQDQAWEAASDEQGAVEADVRQLGDWALDLRAKAQASGLRRIVSSRMVQKAVRARQAGVSVAEVKTDLLAGWTADELRAVGAA